MTWTTTGQQLVEDLCGGESFPMLRLELRTVSSADPWGGSEVSGISGLVFILQGTWPHLAIIMSLFISPTPNVIGLLQETDSLIDQFSKLKCLFPVHILSQKGFCCIHLRLLLVIFLFKVPSFQNGIFVRLENWKKVLQFLHFASYGGYEDIWGAV